MALGKRKPVQQPLFVSTADLNARPHPYYAAVNHCLLYTSDAADE